MTEKRFNARRNEDDDFEDRFKVVLEDVLGIVETDEKTDSVELKKEYYREQSKDKHYTYLDYSKDKYIGSFFCNDVMLKTNEVVELLNENEQLKQSLTNKMDSDAYWEKKAIQRIKKLENENELLKKQLEQYEAVIDRRWKEYVEKEMTE